MSERPKTPIIDNLSALFVYTGQRIKSELLQDEISALHAWGEAEGLEYAIGLTEKRMAKWERLASFRGRLTACIRIMGRTLHNQGAGDA